MRIRAALALVLPLAALAAVVAAIIAVPAAAAPPLLRVGVTSGPHAQVLEVAARVAARDGLQIKIVEFSDYIRPNAALDHGELDANIYQHQPFLDQQVKDRGYHIVSIAKTITFPIAVYSRKYHALADIPARARVAIPNDPTNGGRVLALLAREGVITLRPGAGLTASVADIAANPRSLRFVELDAAQLPRALADVDAAAVNTNYALEAGLQPTRDALVREAAESPYANVIAVRAGDRDRPDFAARLAKLVKAYQSPEVKRFVEDTFKGAIVPAW